MRTVIFLGKRKTRGSPKAQYPGATLWGTTHSNQKYAAKYGTVDDWDAWWDLHPFNAVPGYAGIKARRPKTYAWYQTLPGPGRPDYRPLYLVEPDPTIPAGVVLPWKRIMDEVDVPRETLRWLTCQVDLMILYVIWTRQFDHIVLHGHGMKFGSKLSELEHMIDHCGTAIWTQIARMKGIKVTILEPSWYVGQKSAYGVTLTGWDSLRGKGAR